MSPAVVSAVTGGGPGASWRCFSCVGLGRRCEAGDGDRDRDRSRRAAAKERAPSLHGRAPRPGTWHLALWRETLLERRGGRALSSTLSGGMATRALRSVEPGRASCGGGALGAGAGAGAHGPRRPRTPAVRVRRALIKTDAAAGSTVYFACSIKGRAAVVLGTGRILCRQQPAAASSSTHWPRMAGALPAQASLPHPMSHVPPSKPAGSVAPRLSFTLCCPGVCSAAQRREVCAPSAASLLLLLLRVLLPRCNLSVAAAAAAARPLHALPCRAQEQPSPEARPECVFL